MGEFNPVHARLDEVLGLFQGQTVTAASFNRNFLNAVSPGQLNQFVQTIIAQHGAAKSVRIVRQESATYAIAEMAFADSIATVLLTVEPARPHKIAGLRVTGFAAKADTLTDVEAQITSLPGKTAVLVRNFNTRALVQPVVHNPDKQMAIASASKLYVLAALDNAIQHKELAWSDVVALGPKSHPSGISQTWPDDAPITLHTLATLMISQSDNTATDTLIRILGQDRLAETVRENGHSDPDRMRPFLMTRQVAALKMPGARNLRERFEKASPDERSRLIATNDERLTLDSVDPVYQTARPNHIDSIEWFASANDLMLLLYNLRNSATRETLDILSINPGIDPVLASRWERVLYKGGSEPGVLSMNFVLISARGTAVGISAHWNNPKAALDETKFTALVTRLVDLLAER